LAAVAVRRRQLKWWERPLESVARSRPGGWLAIHVGNPVDQRLLRWSNGRVGIFIGQQVGLLETVGARSGEVRQTPLLYLREGERIVLVASMAGAARHPAWYHNLKAHPRVRFLPRGGPRADYAARQAEGAERERLWAEVNDLYAGYDDYQGRTGGRSIPVVVLEPAGGEAASAAATGG
jgi:deazaflavin-dependent oxidoreductase (nitroreductase family)